jgi:SOS-response transcriptional repressor LexA
VLDVIRERIDYTGVSPTLQEMAEVLGLSSIATVHQHVSALIAGGYATRRLGTTRSLVPLEPGEVARPADANGYTIPTGARSVPVGMLDGRFREWLRRRGYED